MQYDKQPASKTWLKNTIWKSYSVLYYEIGNNALQSLNELGNFHSNVTTV